MHIRLTTPSPAALAPRRGHCTRYERDGSQCRRPTDRNDQWCGTCAGFHRPHRAKTTSGQQQGPRTRRPVAPIIAHTEPLPLDPDEAHDPQLHITRSAIEQYRAKHGSDAPTAEAEIRSLLENLITAGEHQRFENGTWRLLAPEAFVLLLSADAARVISYSTPHRERTYAQVQAAVPSRSRSREKGWVRALQDDLPVRFTKLVLRRFARDVLGIEFTRSTGQSVVEAAYARSQQAQPVHPSHRAGRCRATDAGGLRWHFAYEPGERPVVVHLSWEPGRGPDLAPAQAESA
ncbi:hypothetical protein OG413_44670 [Streptomyces sp. NBC_01433]|uniref:hypothetical protein n=1 Tax=Streptomyces sp. NBC_01433 TaxID=2903864 RepID=UPI002257E1AD|nr:hypothetical protein [Streptomyces sp. NBC_01433]MCX4682279.1 hypothetical protein [Streptomyces sp. NBC_01433]